jgi:hypothetical protein
LCSWSPTWKACTRHWPFTWGGETNFLDDGNEDSMIESTTCHIQWSLAGWPKMRCSKPSALLTSRTFRTLLMFLLSIEWEKTGWPILTRRSICEPAVCLSLDFGQTTRDLSSPYGDWSHPWSNSQQLPLGIRHETIDRDFTTKPILDRLTETIGSIVSVSIRFEYDRIPAKDGRWHAPPTPKYWCWY